MTHDDPKNRSNQCLVLRAVSQPALNRREALTVFGSAIALVAGCSADHSPGGGGGSDGGDRPGDHWAGGGTRKLAGHYPDPFSDPLGSACSITCRETVGPCYGSSLVRRDVSEGYPGLPLRLVLLVVDESCSPVAGASVDIWHTRNTGTYSGTDNGQDAAHTPGGFLAGLFGPGAGSDAGGPPGPLPDGGSGPGADLIAACTAGDADAQSHHYFRGTQTTDSTGRVYFDTCYPGWYVGRAIHIHLIVRRGEHESVVSQLYFTDELSAEIFATHPDYAPRGQPDTLNAADDFFTGLDHTLSTARQRDGAMLAWKTIVLRNSPNEPSCGTDGFAHPPPAIAP
jgi:protocatechuate 3,4-dioxygenase beta subunit